MQDAWTVVGVVLLAVLVGAAVPVLFQFYSTLRVARGLLQRVGPKLDSTLTELRETSQRLNRAGSGVERSVVRARVLLDAAGDLGESMAGLRDSLKTATAVGGALGPALAAAVKALTTYLAHGEPPGDEGPPPDTGEAGIPPEAPSPPLAGEGEPR